METITQSMLGMFLRCPHQFERRYLRGEIIPPGIAARRGSATHEAAQINHEQKLQTQEDLPVADLTDAARDHYVRLITDEGVFIPKDQIAEKDTLLAKGRDAAIRLTELYRVSLAPAIQPLLVEEKMTMDAGLDLPLQGTIDVLTTDNWLPDLKTADKSKGPKEADYSLQLTFYARLVAHQTGKWLEDWANLLLRINLMLAQVQTGLFPPCDPSAWICSPQWCGYFWTCTYSIKRI